jgi:lipid II:glycine glycyltransferase (peptidoglycan interpeptide bridge formation enzyme)
MSFELNPKQTRYVVPTPYLQQTAYWSRLKQKQGLSTKAFDIINKNSSKTAGDILVVLRKIAANATMAYVPFGPELLPDQDLRGPWLEDISEQMKTLPSGKLYFRAL